MDLTHAELQYTYLRYGRSRLTLKRKVFHAPKLSYNICAIFRSPLNPLPRHQTAS